MELHSQQTESSQQPGKHENPLRHEIGSEQKTLNIAAHNEAEQDMAADADLSVHSKNDDLDEGESARLGEDVPA